MLFIGVWTAWVSGVGSQRSPQILILLPSPTLQTSPSFNSSLAPRILLQINDGRFPKLDSKKFENGKYLAFRI